MDVEALGQREIPKGAAIGAGGVGIILLLGSLVLAFIDRTHPVPTNAGTPWGLDAVASILESTVVCGLGILISLRRPTNALGIVFLTAGLGLALGSAGGYVAVHVLTISHGPLPVGRFAAWVTHATWPVPTTMLIILLLLFPTGAPLSGRWRGVVIATCAAGGTLLLLSATLATAIWRTPFRDIGAPGAALHGTVRVALAIITFLFPLGIPPLILLAFVSLVLRFRRSVGEERLQLKWFTFAAAIVAVVFIVSNLSDRFRLASDLALLGLWAAIGVSMLKYRLYEIDVVINKTLVYGALAAFFTAVYVALVVGVGAAIGSSRNPFLTLVAAAVIAIAFNPARERAKRLADRLVYGERATPYEVLSEFSERMADTYALDDILPRMARVLSEGTGGTSEIWLRVGSVLRLVARWPVEPSRSDLELAVIGDDVPPFPEASKATPVLHQGDLLGAITIVKPPNDPLRPAEDKLVDDLAGQAGLVLRNVRLNAELLSRLEELRASRQRLVRAQDEERRKLERNIHDGAQQQLVALSVKLRLLGQLTDHDPEKAKALATELQAESADALENLRDLARGIYPPLLADQGLAAALESQARKAAVPVTVESDGVGRYAQEIEAAVYFCCLEALQNIAKYAEARAAIIRLSNGAETLTFEVADDGRGFDPASTGYGTGLQGMADRLDALGGTLEVRSSPGAGTTVVGRVPGLAPSA
jgi:signal transduction histidine kinase